MMRGPAEEYLINILTTAMFSMFSLISHVFTYITVFSLISHVFTYITMLSLISHVFTYITMFSLRPSITGTDDRLFCSSITGIR
jgi:hypothetical protein